MKKQLARLGLRLVPLLVAFLLGIGLIAVATNLNWLSPFGISHESRDSRVIRTIERTQEVSLLSLGIQGIKETREKATVFGVGIPGAGDTAYVQYEFDAKLGIDGALVRVTKTGDNAYLISVPAFEFIGYADPTFKVAVEDGGPLKFLTPDIDKVGMVNEILNDDARDEYVASYADLLQDQAELFYSSLLKSVDPELVVTFEFRSKTLD